MTVNAPCDDSLSEKYFHRGLFSFFLSGSSRVVRYFYLASYVFIVYVTLYLGLSHGEKVTKMLH